MTTEPAPEPELTEAQKAYNVAQYEIFQLAAYGHCTYTNGELLTKEGKRQQADYNNRIQKAREELEAALLRLVAERAETFRGGWSVPAAWLRSLADDPAEVSLLAVTPEELEEAGLVLVQPEPPTAVSPPPATDRAASYRHAADAIERMQGYPHLILPEEIVAGLRLLAAGAQPEPGSPAYTRHQAAGERDEQQAQGCPDPIECGHEAALGVAEMRLDQFRAKATEWSALAPPDDWGNTPQDTALADAGRYLLRLIDGPAADATPVAASTPRANENDGTVAEERLRCLLCQMPHDLTPGGAGARVCQSIRQRIDEAVQRHGEGDHSLCCRADCGALRQLAATPAAMQPPADTGEETRPRFARVCTPCPECDHTLDENGACANGCRTKEA